MPCPTVSTSDAGFDSYLYSTPAPFCGATQKRAAPLPITVDGQVKSPRLVRPCGPTPITATPVVELLSSGTVPTHNAAPRVITDILAPVMHRLAFPFALAGPCTAMKTERTYPERSWHVSLGGSHVMAKENGAFLSAAFVMGSAHIITNRHQPVTPSNTVAVRHELPRKSVILPRSCRSSQGLRSLTRLRQGLWNTPLCTALPPLPLTLISGPCAQKKWDARLIRGTALRRALSGNPRRCRLNDRPRIPA